MKFLIMNLKYKKNKTKWLYGIKDISSVAKNEHEDK